MRQGEYNKGNAAFPLIAEAVKEFLLLNGNTEHDAAEGPYAEMTADMIRRTPEKRPYLCISGGPDISVTHSGDIWMCLVSAGRCGVDFQYLKEGNTLKIVNRYFTEGEREYIEGGGTGQFTGSFLRSEEGRAGRFFDIWVRRESLGKYEGHGLFGNYPDSAPGGILADEVYFVADHPGQSKRVFVHEITKSMLASAGIKTDTDYRAAVVTESEDAPVIRVI